MYSSSADIASRGSVEVMQQRAGEFHAQRALALVGPTL